MTVFLDNPWLAIVIPIALIAILGLIMRPKVWIALFLISLPALLTEGGKGLSIIELALGGFFTASVVAWLVWRMSAGGPPLIRNWFDVLVITFFIVSIFNVVLASSNGVTPVQWFSEWVLFSFSLYYFPLREYFGRDDHDFEQLLLWFALASVALALYSVYNYRQRMAEGLVYAWQFTASRSVLLGPVFLLAIVLCISRFFHIKNRWRYGLILISLANAVALFLTFTRTLWVMFFLCLAIVMIFLTWRQNVRLVSSIVLATCVVLASAYVYNPVFTRIAVTVVMKRFASSTQLTGGDRSFETRIVEAEYAWRQIKQYPMGGSGLRAPLFTKTPINVHTSRASFIHFGYVALVYKVGFPMAFLFFFALGLQFWMAIRNVWRLRGRHENPLLRSTAIGIVAYFPTLLFVIFVTGFFDQRYGNVMFGFMFACTGIIYDRLNR